MNEPGIGTKISALLATIAEFESGGDYTVIYGGGHFDDLSKHPNIAVPINLPGYDGGLKSTAAGAYQINYPTYTEFAAKLGIYDFSPQSQDALAIEILRSTGAIAKLEAGDVEGAIVAAGKRWASLPGSTSGQPQISMRMALEAYNHYINVV